MSIRSLLSWVARCAPHHIPRQTRSENTYLQSVRKRSVIENRRKVHYRKWVRAEIKGEDSREERIHR